MKPKYLDAFTALKAAPAAASYQLIGDCLLVEEIKDEELKTKSGIILSSGARPQIDGVEANKPVFVRVLAAGEGYFDDESGADVLLDTKPGDIILIGKNSVNWFSVFGNIISLQEGRIGMTRESEVKLRFKGQAGYDDVFATLNASLEVPK